MRFSKKDIARLLEAGAVVGIGAVLLQRLALGAHLSGAPAVMPTKAFRGISVLKPLCGVDDGLEENLEAFASMPYPKHEMILGLERPDDPAAAVAKRVRARHPNSVKIVLKRRDVGHGAKINQLAEIVKAARYEILLVSDSNIRPTRGYFHELNALFGDPGVGCAWNPIVGQGHKTPGAMFDNLQMANVTGQVLGLTAATGALPVVKTYALRRAALESVGGFAAYGDTLADDYIIGRDVRRAGWKVVAGRVPVFNWTEKKTVDDFHSRYARWSTMQSTAEGPVPGIAAGLLNPIPMALGAAVLGGSLPLAMGVMAAKAALEVSSARELGMNAGVAEALAVPAKDVALGFAQLRGIFDRTISWRGKPPLAVGDETRLTPLREAGSHQRPPRRPRR